MEIQSLIVLTSDGQNDMLNYLLSIYKWRWQTSRKEFRVVIVKIIQNLGKKMEKMKKCFIKDLELS